MKDKIIKEYEATLIDRGIKNLKEFGYPSVNKNNILKDNVYSEFFKNMLKDSLATKGIGEYLSEAITNLIYKIETHN